MSQASKSTFSITGMTCAACSARIEKMVGRMEGVLSAGVNLTTEKLTAEYAAPATAESIIATVIRLGYGATLDAPTAKPTDATDNSQAVRGMWLKFAVAICFAALLLYLAMGPMVGLPVPGVVSPAAHPLRYALCQLLLVIPVPGVTSVPLLQIVLHGSVYYAGEPLNYAEDINLALLKCAEYGSVPGALLTYGQLEDGERTYYVDKSPALAEQYTRINTRLADLYSQRITAHGKISEGVYFTEYANTSLVYVNYTEQSVEINGITLNAGDFLRVN